MAKSCETCAYFYPEASLEEWGRRKPFGLSPTMGQCRRFPPSIPSGDGQSEDWFPSVRADDWCGEHSEGAYHERGFE